VPGIAIVARASVEDSRRSCFAAGADRVISPYKSSGTEMARLALHPQVTGVVDVNTEYPARGDRRRAPAPAAPIQTIGDVRGGAMTSACAAADGSFSPQPPADTVLHPGDVLLEWARRARSTGSSAFFALGDRAPTPAP